MCLKEDIDENDWIKLQISKLIYQVNFCSEFYKQKDDYPQFQ